MYQGYDHSNVFARILRNELPCTKIYEDSHVLCFPTIEPKSRFHLLLVPRGPYTSIISFARYASDEEIAGFFLSVSKILTISKESNVFLSINTDQAPITKQEVFHMHVHIMSTEKYFPMKCDMKTQVSEDIFADESLCPKRLWIFQKNASYHNMIPGLPIRRIPQIVESIGDIKGFNLLVAENSKGLEWQIVYI